MGNLYDTAKDVVGKGYNPEVVSSLAGRMAEGIFYDHLKRVRVAFIPGDEAQVT